MNRIKGILTIYNRCKFNWACLYAATLSFLFLAMPNVPTNQYGDGLRFKLTFIVVFAGVTFLFVVFGDALNHYMEKLLGVFLQQAPAGGRK